VPIPPVLNTIVPSLPKDLDPHVEPEQSKLLPFRLTYDTLVNLDAAGSPTPWLATSWTVTGNSIEFHLRPDVRFRDQTGLTPKAIVANVQRAMAPPGGLARPIFRTLESVEETGSMAVRITASGVDPLLLRRLSRLWIASPAYLAQAAGGQPLGWPVGTGQYFTAGFDPGKSFNFQAMPGQVWPSPTPIPYINVESNPDDATRTDQFLTSTYYVELALPLERIPEARLGRIDMVARPPRSVLVVDMDVHSPTFADARVRQALNYAIDKAALINEVGAGAWMASAGQVVPRDVPGFNPSVSDYPYDIPRAKAMLAAAGQAGGFKTALQAPRRHKAAAQWIVAALAKVGVTVSVELLDDDVVVKRNLEGGRAALWLWEIDASELSDGDQALQWFTPAVPATARRLDDAALAELFGQASKEIDATKREDLLRRAGASVHDLAPVLFLAQPVEVVGIRSLASYRAKPDAAEVMSRLIGMPVRTQPA
jgi:ABC-type transport system substrate-binding protein